MNRHTLCELRKLRPGDAYVVHSAAMRHAAQLAIRADLPEEIASKVCVGIVRGISDVDALAAYRGRVVIDPLVQLRIRWEVFQSLLLLAARRDREGAA